MKSVNTKGYRAIKMLCKDFFVVMFLKNIIVSVTPYVNYYLSAELLNELYVRNGKGIANIIVWILILNFAMAILKDFAEIIYNKRTVYLNSQEAYVLCNKVLNLSLEMIESNEIRQKRKRIVETSKIDNNGRGAFIYSIDSVERGIFNLVFACLLAIEMFNELIKSGVYKSLILFILLNIFSIIIYVKFNRIKEMRNNRLANEISNYMVKENQLDDAIDYQQLGKDIRIYGLDNFIIALKEHVLECHKKSFSQYQKKKIKIESWGVVIYFILQIISYVFVGLWTMQKVIKIGSLLKYIGLVQGMINAIMMIIHGLGRLKGNKQFLKEYTDFLDLKSESQTGNLNVPEGDFFLEFQNVSFRYKGSEEYVIKDVSFSVKKGEHIALVGVNGSGKTTLIKLLCRFYQPTKGRICLNNVDIGKIDYKEYVKLISPVFQGFELLPFLISENIAMSNEYDINKVNECMKKALLDEVFLRNNLPEKKYLYKEFAPEGVNVSKGEAQKLAIARALYKDGEIFVLDEPTASLDSLSEIEIYKQFHKGQKNKNVFFITHRLSSTVFCDRIIVLRNGSIVEMGTHDELINSYGEYSKLWKAQAQYYVEQ